MLLKADMKTKVVHCKKEPYDIYIGRPGKWGNPFFIRLRSSSGGFTDSPNMGMGDSREEAINQYREWIKTQPELLASLHELKGKVLGCWCKPQACHGDILVELADAS